MPIRRAIPTTVTKTVNGNQLKNNQATMLRKLAKILQPTLNVATTIKTNITTPPSPKSLYPQLPKHTKSTASNTPLSDDWLEADLIRNAKTFMYPTNVLSTKVVTEHQKVVMASMAAKNDEKKLQIHPEILRYTEHVWAASTMAQRRALWARFVAFRQNQQRPSSMDEAATEFVATLPNISLGTRKSYAVQMSGILRELMIPYPTLSMARKGMVAMGANIPEEKATPIRRDQVHFLLEKSKVRWPLLCLTYWLMWKTASRFADVSELSRSNFKVVELDELILVFGKTKTNQQGTVKMTSLCHIRDPLPMDWQCHILRHLKPEEKIVPMAYATFMRHLSSCLPEMTAHSFKHGAHEFLLQKVSEGNLTADLVPMLMKHSGGNIKYPEQTIAYSSEAALILYARQFRSGEATFLL